MRKYTPVKFTSVKLEGSFWRERLETVLAKTIPSQHVHLDTSGILESQIVKSASTPLRIPRNDHGFTTEIFWDSDIGKWIEAASYALNHQRDTAIEAQIDEITNHLQASQDPDGYLNCWYLTREPENRWTNLRDNHELYCAGHMLEGALAYFQATGNRHLLDIMERYIDHISEVFGPGENQKHGYPGHQEIELALIRLFHETGDRKRLDLATYFINERGKENAAQPHYFLSEANARKERPEDFHHQTFEYNQSHLPVRQQTKVVGHAVRAMYMYAAMADLAADLDDDGLKSACEALWADITEKRMYVTGGFGPSAENEGFTSDYDLPNATAYAETCASVAMIFWAQRMLNLDLDGKYGDTLERALYNGALVGLSRDGENYFYDNPLESDGSHERWAWHPCPCCTMNASRLIASVAGYFYSTASDELAVHLYGGTSATLDIGGTAVKITEVSDYPWSGDISINLDPTKPTEFSLKLRIPAWTIGASASVNGEEIDVASNLKRGYLTIRRQWQSGDTVQLDLPMPTTRIYAHPAVADDRGRVSLARGPLVYCVEQADNPDAVIPDMILPRDAEISATTRDDLFDGIMQISAEGQSISRTDWSGALYRPAPSTGTPTRITALPYYLWNNRGPNPMAVWLRET